MRLRKQGHINWSLMNWLSVLLFQDHSGGSEDGCPPDGEYGLNCGESRSQRLEALVGRNWAEGKSVTGSLSDGGHHRPTKIPPAASMVS